MVSTHKLCWNCDGNVEGNLSRCPYCGVDLHTDAPEEEAETYTPPYRLVNDGEEQVAPPPPPYTQSAADAETKVSVEEWERASHSEDTKHMVEKEEEELKKVLLPMAMLLSGTVFLLFGLVLFLFSEGGVFTLSWNASYSPFYLVAAVPLLYFGSQALLRLED